MCEINDSCGCGVRIPEVVVVVATPQPRQYRLVVKRMVPHDVELSPENVVITTPPHLHHTGTTPPHHHSPALLPLGDGRPLARQQPGVSIPDQEPPHRGVAQHLHTARFTASLTWNLQNLPTGN